MQVQTKRISDELCNNSLTIIPVLRDLYRESQMNR